MIHFRNHNNWLRCRVNYELKKKHNDLFEDDWKRSKNLLKNFIIGKNGWLLILIVVGVLFISLPLIDNTFLNFIQVNLETAKVLVDQRTANITTIISITLVVVGFLINNLALKEPLSYQLLFKHSYLYPIIYFTLSTIGCFVIVSTLRDWLELEKFIRAVVVGTYFVLIVLVMIGLLFGRIIHFTNPKHIEKLFYNELISEAKENIRLSLAGKISSEMFKELMERNNVKKYGWGDPDYIPLFQEIDEEEHLESKRNEKIVVDINLVQIENFISQKSNATTKYYKELALEMSTNETDNYIWAKEQPNSKIDKAILKKSLILKKKPKVEKDRYKVRKYFDQKLEELVSDSKHKNVASLLSSYLELYSLQMKHFPDDNQDRRHYFGDL